MVAGAHAVNDVGVVVHFVWALSGHHVAQIVLNGGRSLVVLILKGVHL